jgi:hypothetical protein
MLGHDDLYAHFGRALHDRIEVVDLKPQQDPVPIRLVIPIADRAVMVLYVEAMQLKHKLAIHDQLFISSAPMIAPAAEHTLIPAAACFDVGHSNEGLRTHSK